MNNIPAFLKNKYIRSALLAIVLLALAIGSGTAYAYSSSPAPIRNPKFEHLHFRMQIVNGGKAVNFADKSFQEGYAKDNCNAELTKNPIHFHDNKDQFVHIHWKDVSGGMVLKYYGWNRIGGPDGLMGYRADADFKAVPIHGRSLPTPKSETMYVYTGDQNGYKQRDAAAFLDQNLESFFNKPSNVPSGQTTLIDKLFPKAAAHNGESHAEGESHGDDEDLKRINNLLGNVVIFVQDKAPSDGQIKDRFKDLEPLTESACAG
jgi:hypothetical protein